MLNWIKALDRILRGEATRLPDLRRGTIDVPLGGLALVILLLGVVYGLCMGTYSIITRHNSPTAFMGYQQAAASAVKVPLLFFLTLLVTFPSLYVFNALVGSRLKFGGLLRLLVASMGVMMALLASFGTIVVFFAVSTTSYAFMVLLNVILFAVSGFVGLGFLLQTLHRITVAQTVESIGPDTYSGATPPAPDRAFEVIATPGDAGIPPPTPPPAGALDQLPGYVVARNVKKVFSIWVIVFALVGAQMSWVLRPFVGSPDADFTFFRERESNFFQAVFKKVGDLLSPDWGGKRR
jgi:hypothetical protein